MEQPFVYVPGLSSTAISIYCATSYSENNATCFRLRCGTLNSNQYKESECVIEFRLSNFNVLTQGLSGQ